MVWLLPRSKKPLPGVPGEDESLFDVSQTLGLLLGVVQAQLRGTTSMDPTVVLYSVIRSLEPGAGVPIVPPAPRVMKAQDATQALFDALIEMHDGGFALRRFSSSTEVGIA